jgi:hypothetical protein
MKLLLVILFALFSASALAQLKPSDVPPGRQDSLKWFNYMQHGMKVQQVLKEREYNIARYQYEIESLKYKKERYAWHGEASTKIFWVVIAIVASGIIFSGIQFYASFQQTIGATSSVKLSTSGVEVNSSVLGVIILVISIAFFYLYLTYVYPIDDPDVTVEQATKKEAAVTPAPARDTTKKAG